MNTINGINHAVTPLNNVNNRKVNVQKYNSNISFTSARSDAALELLDRSIGEMLSEGRHNPLSKLRFHRVLNEAIPYIIQPKNYINAGRESKVYRINDKYVAKIRRGFYENNTVSVLKRTSVIDKKYTELDAYYGEPLIKHGKIEILKNATANNDSLACGVEFMHEHVSSEDLKRYERVFVPKCSSLPQSSFDELAINLKKMNNLRSMGLTGYVYYTPDVINPNNVLISDNRFKIVDKLDTVKFKEPNSLYTMLEPLLLKLNPFQPVKYNEALVEPRKTILKKCLISAEKAELPFESPRKWQYSDWTLLDLFGTECPFEHLQAMRDQKSPLAERQDFIEKFVNELSRK